MYNYNTDFSSEVQFGLSDPITWDGESNILFDLCVENSNSISCNVTSAPGKVIAGCGGEICEFREVIIWSF